MSRSRVLSVAIVVMVLAVFLVAPMGVSAAPAAAPSSGGGGCWYQVRWGQTLAGIAGRYGTSAWYLASLNGLRNINRIYAGQWLRVPCGGGYSYNYNYNYRQPVRPTYNNRCRGGWCRPW